MKKWIYRAAAILLAAICAASAGMYLNQRVQYRENEQSAQAARQTAGLPELTTKPRSPGENTPEEPEDGPWADIDLEALREVNSEVVGWLAMPDTALSYPLLRAGDNQTYLKTDWQGGRNTAGAIFLDYRAAWDPRGFNTIIYGHNMRNGSMFGTLRRYRDAEYWRAHPDIYLIDGGGVHRYEIFSAWQPRVTDAPFQLSFSGEEARREFLETCVSNSTLDTGVEVTAEDEVITLSTCTGMGYGIRWVVQAVLREDG